MEPTVADKLQLFFKPYKQVNFSQGALLISSHEKPKRIFFLEKGIVRQYAVSKDGNEMTLNLYKPGAFFPMAYAFNSTANRYNFEATGEATVRIAPVEAVITFLKTEPDVLLDLTKRVFLGLDGLLSHVEQLMSGNAQARLIMALIVLAKRFGVAREGSVTLPQKLTHQDVASLVGLSRETVSRELMHLKQRKLLDYANNTITIFDVKKLEQHLAGENVYV